MNSTASTLVALIGRPNVGKSTLFNRLNRRRDALVAPTPGVTRDRHYARIDWKDHAFTLVDTGGIEDEAGDMGNRIREQALLAVDEADIIFFLMDGREGPTPGDAEIAAILRRSEKTVFHIVNKIDSPELEESLLSPFWELGAERLWPLSADHGHGFTDLMEVLPPFLNTEAVHERLPENTLRVAFLGRPNVGKSSLINTIVGETRMLVSDVAGTTRDAVDTHLSAGQYSYLLIDTAGIRRRGKTKNKLEKFSVLKTLRALGRCDLALVLLDAAEGITDQDIRIIGYAQEQGKALMVLLNKWDLLAQERGRQLQLLDEVRMALKFIPFVPVLKVSAQEGTGIRRLFPEMGRVQRQYGQRFPTAVLNRLLAEAVERHEPPLYHGRRLKFYYTSQLATAPPRFVVVTNAPKGVHFSYQRYLINCFRDGLGLDRVPVQVFFRERSGRRGKK